MGARPGITRTLTIVYVSFLLAIIYLANTGELPVLLSLLKDVPFGDTMGHFVLMGILSFLINRLMGLRQVRILGWNILLGSLVVSGVVLAEEVGQLFLPNRTFSLLDLTADAAGIWLFGWWALRLEKGKDKAGCADPE